MSFMRFTQRVGLASRVASIQTTSSHLFLNAVIGWWPERCLSAEELEQMLNVELTDKFFFTHKLLSPLVNEMMILP